eukprot:6183417-Pleurochrysis_carterae.AAC.2
MSSYRTAKDDLAEEKRRRGEVEAECKQLRADLAKATAQLRTAASGQTRFDHIKLDLAAAYKKQEATTLEFKAANAAALQYKTEVSALRKRLESAEQCASELKQAGAGFRGRPRGHAGAAEVEQRWETMSLAARRTALCRHSSDIKDALLDGGCDDWLPSSLALALESLGILDNLLRTKIVALARFKTVEELAALLKEDLSIELSLFVRSELNISDADYDKLRLSFCKRYDPDKARW